MYCYTLLSEGERVAVRAERVTATREGLAFLTNIFTPLSRISNAHCRSQRTATSSIGEVDLQDEETAATKTLNSQFTIRRLHKKSAYTLAEIIIVLVVIAVVVVATMRVAKTRLDNITTYTYYAAYSVLNDVSNQMLADYSPSRNEYIDFAFLKKFIHIPNDMAFADIIFPDFGPDYYAYGCPVVGKFAGHSGELVFAKRFNKCIFQEDLNLYYFIVNNVAQYKNCSGKRKLYRTQDSNGLYSYLTNHSAGSSSIFFNTYSYNSDSCNYSCNDGSNNNCGGFTEYSTDFHCMALGAGPDGQGVNDYAFSTIDSTMDTNDNIRGNHTKIINSEFLGGTNVCKYKVRCPIGGTVHGNSFENSTNSSYDGWGSLEGLQNNYCSYEDKPAQCQAPSGGCSTGSVWRGEPTCSCVPEPPTIPRKGINFCEMFVSLANTKAGDMCKGTKVEANTTDFSGITEDIVLRNGMKIYNATQNPNSIADLVGNDTGGTVTKTDGTTFDTNIAGYTLYVDIDGSSGESKLWEDVFPFYVTLSGKVIPAYKTDSLGEFGGDSRYYMQTSIQVDSVDNTGATQYWLLKSKSFKESACKAGYVGQNTLYCSRHDVSNPSVTKDTVCSQEQNSCSVKKVSPIRGF